MLDKLVAFISLWLPANGYDAQPAGSPLPRRIDIVITEELVAIELSIEAARALLMTPLTRRLGLKSSSSQMALVPQT